MTTLSDLKNIERFARANSSKKSTACEKWDVWAEQWIANENTEIITSIDNYHHARHVIKNCKKYCRSAVSSGNCVTIFFGERYQ